ncbi:MAG: hypothetical protein PHP45_05540 [Elusimicrobiales bacterium]|nr:hypothetical protein [Elusimicrobiales bacterium]
MPAKFVALMALSAVIGCEAQAGAAQRRSRPDVYVLNERKMNCPKGIKATQYAVSRLARLGNIKYVYTDYESAMPKDVLSCFHDMAADGKLLPMVAVRNAGGHICCRIPYMDEGKREKAFDKCVHRLEYPGALGALADLWDTLSRYI